MTFGYGEPVSGWGRLLSDPSTLHPAEGGAGSHVLTGFWVGLAEDFARGELHTQLHSYDRRPWRRIDFRRRPMLLVPSMSGRLRHPVLVVVVVIVVADFAVAGRTIVGAVPIKDQLLAQ